MTEKEQNNETLNKDFKEPKIRFREFKNSWKYENLESLVSIHARIGRQGLKQNEQLDFGDIYLITGTDFKDGLINFKTSKYVSEFRYNQDKNIQLKNDDILITKDGTLGKVAIIRDLSKKATLNSGIYRIRIKDLDKVCPNYLYQYLAAPFLLDFAGKTSIGGTIKHLNQSQIIKFPIPLTILAEQQKICDFLAKLDFKLSFVNNKISILKKYKEGILLRIKRKNNYYIKLGQICDTYQPKTIPRKSFNKNGQFPVYGANGIIGWYDEYNHEYEQIIVGCRGNCGSIQLTRKKSRINGNAMVIKPKHELNINYLYYLLQCVRFDKLVEKSGVPQITCNKIKELKIPLVSNQEIFELLIRLDSKIDALSNKLSKISHLKKFFLKNLFI